MCGIASLFAMLSGWEGRKSSVWGDIFDVFGSAKNVAPFLLLGGGLSAYLLLAAVYRKGSKRRRGGGRRRKDESSN